ncbi:hypothetical protein NDU88_001312, partial [Pleurodeles waltl]
EPGCEAGEARVPAHVLSRETAEPRHCSGRTLPSSDPEASAPSAPVSCSFPESLSAEVGARGGGAGDAA